MQCCLHMFSIQCTGDDVAHALLEGGSVSQGDGRGGGYRGGGGGYRGGRGDSSRGDSSRGDSSRGDGRGDRRWGRQRHNSGGGAIVKARGLPYSTSEWELASFFDGYDVSSILLKA